MYLTLPAGSASLQTEHLCRIAPGHPVNGRLWHASLQQECNVLRQCLAPHRVFHLPSIGGYDRRLVSKRLHGLEIALEVLVVSAIDIARVTALEKHIKLGQTLLIGD